MNQLSGCVPDSIGGMEQLAVLGLGVNQLSGTITDMICNLKSMGSMLLFSNYLAGPLPTCISNLCRCNSVFVDENRLVGTISEAIMPMKIWHFQASRNYFEGTMPRIPATLKILGLTPSPLGPQLHGPISNSLARLQKLDVLLAQRQKLEGIIFAMASSVQFLALYENRLKRLLNTRFKQNSHILLQHNALSCHLPRALNEKIQPNTSVCAVGNQLQEPSPEWLSSYDRNGIFWSSGHEGSIILAKVGGMAVILAASVWSKHDWKEILAALTSWHRNPGCQYLLKVCASQLPYVSCRVVVSVLFVMTLVDWSFYICPGTLTLASACHIDSMDIQWAVVFLWFEVSVHWHFLLKRWTPQTSSSGGPLAQHPQVWVMWVVLMLPLSSLAMLNMTSMCVPDFLQIGELWLNLVNLGIGACQALMSSLVIPRLAGALTPSKHFYISVASVLTSVCFPAACVMYFDHACFGGGQHGGAPVPGRSGSSLICTTSGMRMQ